MSASLGLKFCSYTKLVNNAIYVIDRSLYNSVIDLSNLITFYFYIFLQLQHLSLKPHLNMLYRVVDSSEFPLSY